MSELNPRERVQVGLAILEIRLCGDRVAKIRDIVNRIVAFTFGGCSRGVTDVVDLGRLFWSTHQLLICYFRVIDLIGTHSGFGGWRFNGFEIVNVKDLLRVRLVVLEFNAPLRELSVGPGQFRRANGNIHSGKFSTLSWFGSYQFHCFGFENFDNLLSGRSVIVVVSHLISVPSECFR